MSERGRERTVHVFILFLFVFLFFSFYVSRGFLSNCDQPSGSVIFTASSFQLTETTSFDSLDFFRQTFSLLQSGKPGESDQPFTLPTTDLIVSVETCYHE